MKTIRQILAFPIYLAQMAVALAMLWPMKLMAQVLMRGMIGGQRHVYYPIAVGRRIVAGEPAWKPIDYFHLGVEPRTDAERAQLDAEMTRMGAEAQAAATAADLVGGAPPVIMPVLPVVAGRGLIEPAVRSTCDPAAMLANVARLDTPNVADQIAPGRRASLGDLRHEVYVAQMAGRAHAVLDYRFVAADYADETRAWAPVEDARIVANVDATHAMMNKAGGVAGKLLSRQTDDTPLLVAILVTDGEITIFDRTRS